MSKYVEVDLYVLEELLAEFKATKLSLMYEVSVDFDKDRMKIQSKIDEFRLWLDLPPDKDPIKNDLP
jgi:hypothetical protein